MTTIIRANGRQPSSQGQDCIETLLDVLVNEPLDHRFERMGNFIEGPVVGRYGAMTPLTYFHGNFARVSHPFSICTDDPALIATLTAAIRKNQARDDYGPNGNHW